MAKDIPVGRRIGGAGFHSAHFPELSGEWPEVESDTACLICGQEECICDIDDDDVAWDKFQRDHGGES